MRRGLEARLSKAPAGVLAAYALVCAFGTYFCMYAFRRPFVVGSYPGGVTIGGLTIDHKTLFVVAQVFGYAASKVLGIKIVSELPPARRALGIVLCIGVAEAALALFGVVPAPYNAVCLVLNGLPLGMVWGLVFGFLEGRRTSDVLGAGLSASFIVASGFVKTAGKIVLGWGVPDPWMPAVTGALFAPLLVVFVVLLARVPPPTPEDEAERVKRAPMTKDERRAFLSRHRGGMILLTLGYVMLTAYRDFRDAFAREIWDALGYAKEPAVLTTAEIPVAVGALVAVGATMLVRDNKRALAVVHLLLVFGAALVGASTLAYRAGMISPAAWMVLVGLGLYAGYVPFNCVLFDRLVAASGSVATAGFLIYVADASGYVGSSLVMMWRSLFRPRLASLEVFVGLSYATSAVCVVLFGAALAWFAHRLGRGRDVETREMPAPAPIVPIGVRETPAKSANSDGDPPAVNIA